MPSSMFPERTARLASPGVCALLLAGGATAGAAALAWENAVRPALEALGLLAYFWGLGTILSRLRAFRAQGRDPEPLDTLALGISSAIPVILAFGFAGFLRPAAFLPFAALIALAGIWRTRLLQLRTQVLSRQQGRAPDPARAEPRPTFPDPSPLRGPTWDPRRNSQVGQILVIAFALLLAGLAVLSLVPDFSWDALLYHLAVGKIYLQQGRILEIPWLFAANFPANGDLLFLHGLMIGGERGAMAVDLVLALLAVAATYRLARIFLSPSASAFAGLVFALSPDLLAALGSCGVELCWTAFATSSLACALLWRKGPRGFDPWLHLAAVFAGFASGTKVLGLGSAAAVGAVFLLSQPGPGGSRLRPAIRFASVSLLAASPCYLKTWIHTGTPVWPFAFGIFPVRGWNAQAEELVARVWRDQWAPLSHLPWSSLPGAILDRPWQRGSFLLALVLLLLAGTAFRRRLYPETWPLALFASVHLLMWWCVTQQSRFLMPCLPAALVGLLVLMRPPAGAATRAARAVGTIAFLSFWLAVFAAWSQFWPYKASRLLHEGLPILAGQLSHEQVLDEIPFHDVCRRTNELAPPGSRIFLYGEVRGFWLDREYVSGDPVSQIFVDYRSMPDPAAFEARLRELGITHVLVGNRPERDLGARRATGYDFHTESLVRDVLVRSRRTPLGPTHALYDLSRPNPEDRPVLVASSTESSDRTVDGIFGAAGEPADARPGEGWKAARVPDASEPEEILVLFPRERALHRVRIVCPKDSPGTPTDVELLWDQGGAWSRIAGAPAPGARGEPTPTFEFGPIQTRRLRVVIRGTRGGPPEVARIEGE